ncbi:hypothetical protein [Listeria booriae]|uniref:hypothetical protein n=1 Tax=Listeria booriae TaxID=1552123 RepID=UPI00162599E5|nr:hypothetical protein [Listeria booriae]MBC2391314.1 hypothetical protein [Listeria booriae]
MKKLFLLLLIGILATLVACGNGSESAQSADDSNNTQKTAPVEETVAVPNSLKDISSKLGESAIPAADLIVEDDNYIVDSKKVDVKLVSLIDDENNSINAILTDDNTRVKEYKFSGSNPATLGLLILALENSGEKVDMDVSEAIINATEETEANFQGEKINVQLKYNPTTDVLPLTATITVN